MSETAAAVTNVPAWLPVATLILGGAIGAVSEYFRDRRTTQRERESRAERRREEVLERRNTFQRQTLLDLQEAVFSLARSAGATHHHDSMTNRASGEWKLAPVGEETNQMALQSQVQVGKLLVRVRDGNVRELAAKMKDLAGTISVAQSREQSDQAMRIMASVHDDLNERIGAILRHLDDEMEEFSLS